MLTVQVTTGVVVEAVQVDVPVSSKLRMLLHWVVSNVVDMLMESGALALTVGGVAGAPGAGVGFVGGVSSLLPESFPLLSLQAARPTVSPRRIHARMALVLFMDVSSENHRQDFRRNGNKICLATIN